MSETVTVPSLMRMTLIVSEESLARDRRTHTHTQRLGSSFLKFANCRLQLCKERSEIQEAVCQVMPVTWCCVSDRRLGYCYLELVGGRCVQTPDLARLTKAECCCSLASAWGRSCERCPSVSSSMSAADPFSCVSRAPQGRPGDF